MLEIILEKICAELKDIKTLLATRENSDKRKEREEAKILIRHPEQQSLSDLKKILVKESEGGQPVNESVPEPVDVPGILKISLKALKTLATETFGNLKDADSQKKFKELIEKYAELDGEKTLNLDHVKEEDYEELMRQIKTFDVQ
jgi:hypothetical protein